MKNSLYSKFSKVSPLLILLFLGSVFTQCSKKNEVFPLNQQPTSGSDKISTYDGSWRYDKAHCGVNWETMYFVDNAMLTGKFNNHNVNIEFDEANPSAGKIEAWVQLSTFNTGEPGRDGPGLCGPNYMGVEYLDTLFTVDPASDTAWFNSTSIERFGDGYHAKGDLTFRGVTKSQDLYFTYLGQKDYSSPPDGSNIRGGFMGELSFFCRTDYGVSSTSIADKVTLTINVNLRKN